jgi:leucyl-tRNA synthetase
MFMGPLEVSKPWSSTGVAGARKFINRVWNFFSEPSNVTMTDDGTLTKIYHQTVKKVTSDFETLGFNTAIAQMMIFINEVYKNGSCPKEYAEGFVKMMSCITPHVCEEIWQILGHNESIAYESWPTYDEAKCVDNTIEMPIQVNGKVRSVVMIAKDADKDSVLAVVKADEKVASAIDGKTIVKEIVVPGKIINIVVK